MMNIFNIFINYIIYNSFINHFLLLQQLFVNILLKMANRLTDKEIEDSLQEPDASTKVKLF